MNDKQRILIFFSVLFIIFSVFIIDQFSNTATNDPLQDMNFVVVNEQIIFVELAITPQEREKGLMERKVLEDNNGMLLCFRMKANIHFG